MCSVSICYKHEHILLCLDDKEYHTATLDKIVAQMSDGDERMRVVVILTLEEF